MSSQLVDLNADGHNDILVGSFSGVPQMIYGSEEGYTEPVSIMDSEEEVVLIADFWNYETKEWDETDRAGSKGHCTSSAAVDWDNDGDLDLILGDYYGGALFLRLNEGTSEEPSFAKSNEEIMAGGKHIVVPKGLSNPTTVDWNGDGLFDILCGGSKGGIYYYENIGEKGAPEFARGKTLLKQVHDKANSFMRRVPAVNGVPTQPGSSLHIEPCDYDGDGDIDLLVGSRCSWSTGPEKKLTEEQVEAKEELQAKSQELLADLQEMLKDIDKEEREELYESDEYQDLMKEYREIFTELEEYKTEQVEQGEFVWLLRRK